MTIQRAFVHSCNLSDCRDLPLPIVRFEPLNQDHGMNGSLRAVHPHMNRRSPIQGGGSFSLLPLCRSQVVRGNTRKLGKGDAALSRCIPLAIGAPSALSLIAPSNRAAG